MSPLFSESGFGIAKKLNIWLQIRVQDWSNDTSSTKGEFRQFSRMFTKSSYLRFSSSSLASVSSRSASARATSSRKVWFAADSLCNFPSWSDERLKWVWSRTFIFIWHQHSQSSLMLLYFVRKAAWLSHLARRHRIHLIPWPNKRADVTLEIYWNKASFSSRGKKKRSIMGRWVKRWKHLLQGQVVPS